MKNFFKVSLEIIIYIGLYLASQVMLTFILGIIYGIHSVIKERENINPAVIQMMLDQNIHYILMGSILIALISYSLLYNTKSDNLFKCCNFSAIRTIDIGLVVLLGIAFNCLLTMINVITSFEKLFPDHEKIIATLIGGDFISTLLIVGIIVPIFEEVLFRGIVFNKLRKYMSLTTAVVIQGIIFGTYHMNFLQGIYGTILGILAALIYSWLNSLWAPICIHASFNILSVVMSRVAGEQIINKYGLEILTFSGLTLGFSIFTLWKRRINQTNSIKEQFVC